MHSNIQTSEFKKEKLQRSTKSILTRLAIKHVIISRSFEMNWRQVIKVQFHDCIQIDLFICLFVFSERKKTPSSPYPEKSQAIKKLSFF